MSATELRLKTLGQLLHQLEELKRESFNLRFQAATNQLENTSRFRQVRREIARLKTVINEKDAEGVSDA